MFCANNDIVGTAAVIAECPIFTAASRTKKANEVMYNLFMTIFSLPDESEKAELPL